MAIKGSTEYIKNLPDFLYIAVRNSVFKWLEKENKLSKNPESGQVFIVKPGVKGTTVFSCDL